MIPSRSDLLHKFTRMSLALILAVLLLSATSLLLQASVSRAAASTDQAVAHTSLNKTKVQAGQAITVIYSQPPSGTMFLQSSQIGYEPYGSNSDQYVWDDFTLSYTYAITQLTWRGEYLANGSFGGPITDFVVSLYTSTPSGWQPNYGGPPLVQYTVGDPAGEDPPWTGGSSNPTFHNYSFTLPAPFTAEAGLKYWVQIEGIQSSIPDWGVVGGRNGNGVLFIAMPGVSGFQYSRASGDIAFSLSGPELPFTHTLTITKAGNGSGVVTPTVGMHLYTSGMTVTLQATPATGSTFTGWSGDTDCASGTVTLNADKSCTATFISHFIFLPLIRK